MSVLNGTCPMCKGHGAINGPGGTQLCPMCDGSGKDPGVPIFNAYTSGPIALLANQLLPKNTLLIRGGAPFQIQMLTRVSTGTFRFRLYDASNKAYMSGGVGGTTDLIPDKCIFGDGSLPFVMGVPITVGAGSVIIFDLQDTSGAPNTVELVFIGQDIYPTPAN